MSTTRRKKRAARVYIAALTELLGGFYEFLSQSPQPSDEEVRNEFIRREKAWKDYCAKKQLSKSAYQLFKSEVAQAWARKQAKYSQDNSGKQTL